MSSLSWTDGGYRFVVIEICVVLVYNNNVYVDTFNVPEGVRDLEKLREEANAYLKFIKQKY